MFAIKRLLTTAQTIRPKRFITTATNNLLKQQSQQVVNRKVFPRFMKLNKSTRNVNKIFKRYISSGKKTEKAPQLEPTLNFVIKPAKKLMIMSIRKARSTVTCCDE